MTKPSGNGKGEAVFPEKTAVKVDAMASVRCPHPAG